MNLAGCCLPLLRQLVRMWARLIVPSPPEPFRPGPGGNNNLRHVYCGECLTRKRLVRCFYRASLIDGDCYRCPLCSADIDRKELFTQETT
jgi:hypothetical protein